MLIMSLLNCLPELDLGRQDHVATLEQILLWQPLQASHPLKDLLRVLYVLRVCHVGVDKHGDIVHGLDGRLDASEFFLCVVVILDLFEGPLHSSLVGQQVYEWV